jgi:quercetin dioxygenase-like cupin family protein
MSNEQATPETKGVTAELLATVDLGREIEGMAGRQLRMRLVTIEPGGVFGPIHDHRDRPGIVYVLQGTITTIEMESPPTPGVAERSIRRTSGDITSG